MSAIVAIQQNTMLIRNEFNDSITISKNICSKEMPYILTNSNKYNVSLSNEQYSIKEKIEELQSIEMSVSLKSRIEEYAGSIPELLKSYGKGENNNIFKENNFLLYSKIQHLLSMIIDVKYDLIENKIETKNKKQIINKLETIIEEHKNIIEDINKTVIPDINI